MFVRVVSAEDPRFVSAVGIDDVHEWLLLLEHVPFELFRFIPGVISGAVAAVVVVGFGVFTFGGVIGIKSLS